MRRTLGCLLAVALLASPAAAESVEEWQIRGILAGLKDGYPQVRALAASELDDLLRSQGEWKGQSASLADEARDPLREMLKDADPDIHTVAARALTRLYERGKDAAALTELLHDSESRAGLEAADSLAHLYERAGDMSGLRAMLRDADPNASWSALQALTRVHEAAKDAAALRGLLGDPSQSGGHWYVAQALARLYQGTNDVPKLREMLKGASPDVRREAAAALAFLGEKDATAILRESLKDPRANVRERVAEVLAGVAGRRKDAAALRQLLGDASAEVREKAGRALARLYGEDKNTVALRDLLRDGNADMRREAAQELAQLYVTAKNTAGLREMLQISDTDVYHEGAWGLVRLAQAEGDRTALRDLLQAQDSTVSREAAWALGRLGEKEIIPHLHELLRDPYADARRETALVLTGLGDADLPAVLRIPYEDLSYLYWARWLAHYWGGRRPEVARVLCAYLGRPKEAPRAPVSDGPNRNAAILTDLRVLREEAWEKTDSPWMKEDVAGWWSWLITQEGVAWSGADEVAELKRVRDALGTEALGRRHAAAIDRVLGPLETFPSPFARTWLVFAVLNLVAVLFALLGRRLGAPGRWLPIVVFLAGVLAVVLTDVAGWDYRARTIPWLLAVISLVEVGLILGVVTPARSAGEG
jgi:HEAT repeat protein